MRGYIVDIETAALENTEFRRVLYTAEHSQLVLMSLQPGEDIGAEVHQLDQFIRCESGTGKAELNGEEHEVTAGTAVVVPAGSFHNITNTSADSAMKLYTVYSPPAHKEGTVHHTKADAEHDEEDNFDPATVELES